jgi:hypothetical protein
MEFEWLKFGHVVTIMAAIALAEGPILPLALVLRRRDVPGIRHAIETSRLGERYANPLVLAAIAFGIAAALAGQIDLTASWLIAAYLLLVLAVVIGAAGGFRHEERLEAAAAASPDDTPSAELEALIRHPWTRLLTYFPPVIMATVVLLMVVKPRLF